MPSQNTELEFRRHSAHKHKNGDYLISATLHKLQPDTTRLPLRRGFNKHLDAGSLVPMPRQPAQTRREQGRGGYVWEHIETQLHIYI